jgi:hypothetical protein
LNDVRAVRKVDSDMRLVVVTVISSVPFTFGLVYSLLHADPWPHWFYWWLVISYGFLLLGQLRAWWLPYLVFPNPRSAERYRVMFAKLTLSFQRETALCRIRSTSCCM